MLIAVHPDRAGDDSYSDKWITYLEGRGIGIRIVDLKANDFVDQLTGCDGVMWRWRHDPCDRIVADRILLSIESYLQLPVFPNHSTFWHYDEKLSQHYLFQTAGIPTPETWIFWDPGEALAWAKKAIYPVVFKLSAGAGSSCVTLVEDFKHAEGLIHRMFGPGIYPYEVEKKNEKLNLRNLLSYWKHDLASLSRLEMPNRKEPDRYWWRVEKNYAYFQEFLPGNSYDTRITVIGNRAFGFRRFNRPDDFRASGSGNFCTDPSKIDLRCVEMAHDISQKLGFQSMAYDFIYKDDLPVVSEISYTFIDEAVYCCPGYWDQGLNWIEGQMWPEEAQVIDLLEYVKASKNVQLV